MSVHPTRSLTRRACVASLAGGLLAQQQRRPLNLVVILADDLGYGDLGCYGGPIRTPNLDRMASEGLRFTNALSANPVCSPSRAGLLTGRYPTRTGVPDVLFPTDEKGLDLGETTLADLLRGQGYRTACIGKWHLGHRKAYLPTQRGFDSYFGIPYSNDMTPCPLMENETVAEEPARQETLTRRYTERAVEFLRDGSGKPFFLYMPHTFPHVPLFASEAFRGKSELGLYGDVVMELDWSAGEVFRALKSAGRDRDTLVVFTSDNGPWHQGSAGGQRLRKGDTYEGGMRVPFLAWQPGVVRRGVSSELVSSLDLLPTVASRLGLVPPKPADGVDLHAHLTKGAAVPRECMLYFNGNHLQCIRRGNWKLHLSRFNTFAYNPAPAGGRLNLRLAQPELYNLTLDPAESYDVAGRHPEIVKELAAKAEQMIAGFPEPVRVAWAETLQRQSAPQERGALPRPRQN